MEVDGKTQLVGIIGYPIDYTLSPAIHNAAFRALGMNWLYVPLRVEPGKGEAGIAGLRALGFKGANVTIPHKTEVVPCLDELRGDALTLEAANTVVSEGGRLVGYNTDAAGFEAFLRQTELETEGSNVLLIGAGGASRAVALALARSGAARIYVMNRTARKAGELAALLKRANFSSEIFERTFDQQGAQVMRECEVVINCTPLAAVDASELPLDYGDFRPGQWAIDLNYSKAMPAFLGEASSRGARVANGVGMLLHQAAESFRLWTGEEPPLEAMKLALRKALGDSGG